VADAAEGFGRVAGIGLLPDGKCGTAQGRVDGDSAAGISYTSDNGRIEGCSADAPIISYRTL